MDKQNLKSIGLLFGAVLLVFLIGWACPFYFITGIPCPGCGMSRALIALAHGNVSMSLWYHPMLVPTAIAAILLVIFRNDRKTMIRILTVWAIFMIIVWIWRLMAVFPEPPMNPRGGFYTLLKNGGNL